MPEMNPHQYRAVTVPAGCTQYVVDGTYELLVEEPPPESITIGGTTACAGTQLRLDEEA